MLQESGLKNQLVHHKEGIYFALTLLFSILTYVALLFSIIGIAMIIALMLISYFFHAISMASIRRNGVRLSERQFPKGLLEKAVKVFWLGTWKSRRYRPFMCWNPWVH